MTSAAFDQLFGGPVRDRSALTRAWAFMLVRKKLWRLPIILMLLVGALLAFAQGSALAPFIYTIF